MSKRTIPHSVVPRVSWLLCLLGLVTLPDRASAQHRAGDLERKPVELRSARGGTVAAERGRLWVPENRRRKDTRLIELAFVRLKSTADEPGPPMIYLHGGPGGSATGAAGSPRAVALYQYFLGLGDVVLLDQRGCGRSKPRLAQPLAEAPPPDVMRDSQAYEDWLARASVAAKARLDAAGVDITGYDTEQNADDVDDLRAALGAEKMRLLGFSYGTHLGLSVIRRHGERVDSAVLIGVEGPAHTRKLPSTYEAQIEKLSALIAKDSVVGKDVPDFAGLLRRVLAKLEKKPMEVRVPQPLTGRAVTVPVGPDALRLILVRDLGDTNDLPVFPRLLWTIDHDDPSVLTWFVRKRYSGSRFFPTHAFTMDPASGCSPARAARIAAEAKNAVLGDVMNFVFPKVEAVWRMPVLGDHFRAPLVSDVRTLFLSGTLDANTPPYQAEQMRWGFLDATHLVQRHGGHEDWQRNPKVLPVIRGFFAGEDVTARDVDMPPLRFIPVRGKPTAVTHPSVGG